MDITVTELEPCKLSIKYIAGSEEMEEKKSAVLKEFKKAPVKGFRKGKANINAIKFHYKKQIEDSLKRAMAESAYHNTIFNKNLRPYGMPDFKSAIINDNIFTCEFNIFTKPDFELATFKDLEIPKPHSDINIIELAEKMVQELRVRFGEVNPYSDKDTIQVGDNVVIDYEGTIDDKKIDSLSFQGEMLTIGTNAFVNFDDNILGMFLGETREFDIIGPDGGLPSFVGKNIHFKVTLNTGSKIIPHPLNDELAKKIGKNTFTEFKEFVYAAASGKVESAKQNQLLNALIIKLVEDNNINIPNWLNLSEAQYLVHHAKLDWNTLTDLDKEKYLDMASKNIKLSLILDRIRESETEAQLSDQEILSIIKQNIDKSKISTSMEDALQQMEKSGQLQVLISKIRDQHTLDFVVKTIKWLE